MASKPDIVLYNYAFSPYGKRISAYLALRGIENNRLRCHDLTSHSYRCTIDVSLSLAIGRDIYLDTRLILRVLETLPSVKTPPLGATKPQDKFVEKLLEKYMIEGPVFTMAGGLVPVDVAQDPTFKKDRQGMLGRTWEKKELEEGRSECLNYIRNLYNFFETTILADEREWVLGGEGPRLADIEAIFMLDFVSGMQLPEGFVSAKLFPRVFAWLDRYRAAVDAAKSSAPEPSTLNGQSASESILRSDFGHSGVSIDEKDPAGFREGVEVEIYPADWVTEHRDRGRLVGLTADEVTIAVKAREDVEIRIHAPRTGFKVEEIRTN